MPQRLDIAIQRNEAWTARVTLTDDADAPIDLTGKTIVLQVKSRLDNSTVIQSAVIEVDDPETGVFDVTLDAGQGHPLHGQGNALQTVRLPYDLLIKDVDGVGTPIIAGYVILSRGVSS